MSLFSIFKDKLSKTSNILSFNILEILKNKKIDDLTLEELENVLISSDISLDVVNQLIDSIKKIKISNENGIKNCLLYTSPSPRDTEVSRMPSSA